MKKTRLLFLFSLFILAQNLSFAQLSSDSLYSMSLEELMKVSIVSASREKEDVYDAPVTAYVITRKEIEKAGATSIPEALRLCPGLFVTEMANGSYQVDIRGLNNIPALELEISNKTILTMVDNRPVFNQFQGGTYWENLPVDINDVERIEVVAGPAAALYGPNAATGVINIITRRVERKGLMVYSNSQHDFKTNSFLGNLSVGYKINTKLSLLVSGNYSKRNRHVVDYYYSGSPSNTGNFVTYDQINDSKTPPQLQKQKIYANPDLAASRGGANVYLEYKHTDKVKFDFSAGLQDAVALKMVSLGTGFTMAYFPANSWYVRGKGEINGFSIQVSNNQGTQGFVKGVPSYRYDFRTTDLYVDYTYKYKNLLSFRPALSYENAFISDLPYIVPSLPGVFNNEATMYNYAGSLKIEYTPITMLRFVGAIRADRFRYPESTTFLSYEFVANIKPNENNNIRLIASRAYQGSYIFPTSVDFSTGTSTGVESRFIPNKNLQPGHIDLYEVGYRAKLTSNFNADISIFNQQGVGFYTLLSNIALEPTGVKINLQHDNIALKAIQTGVTLSLNAVLFNNKLQFKPFITVSQTKFKNYTPYRGDPSPVDGGLNNKSSYSLNAKNTPTAFGGMSLNVQPTRKLNANLSVYGFGKYSLYSFLEQPSSPSIFNPAPTSYMPYLTSPASEIESNIMLNAKVSYEVHRNVKVFVNGRNILNNGKRQFYGGEQIGAMYLVGINLDIN